MRRPPIAPMSAKRRAALAANGIAHPSSTLVTRKVTTAKRSKDTGPKQPTRTLVHVRSGDLCEFVWCPCRAEQMHHRRPRRMGGSSGVGTNCPSNLVHLCSAHHSWVESNRTAAVEMGLILPATADPARVPVLLRHDKFPVWLTPTGGWVRFEEACA